MSRRPILGREDIAAALAGRRVTRSVRDFRVAARQVVCHGRQRVVVAGQSLRPVQESVRKTCRPPATRSPTSAGRSTRCSTASSAASRSRQRLVADASHELRTPPAAMRAELDVGLRGELEPGARRVLLSVREEVDRTSRTVDDLPTLATVDQGRALGREAVDCRRSPAR